MDKRQNYDPDVAAESPRATIMCGEYDAICYKAKYGVSHGGRKDLYLNFRIHGGEYHNLELFMVISPPRKLTQRTKKWQQWALAMGRPPIKGELFSKKVFLGKLYRVLVRLTASKFGNGKLKPDYLQYSVIDSILETQTGVPVK